MNRKTLWIGLVMSMLGSLGLTEPAWSQDAALDTRAIDMAPVVLLAVGVAACLAVLLRMFRRQSAGRPR